MIAILGKAASPPPELALAREMLAAAPHRGSCTTLRVLGNCVLGVANRPDSADATLSSEGPLVAALSGRLDNAAELHQALTAAGSPPESSARSEEHTSELQSRQYLVCRL